MQTTLDSYNFLQKIPEFIGSYAFPVNREKTVAILGSSKDIEGFEQYQRAASDVTRHFIENGYNVVHGCGSKGVMGEVMRTAAQYSAKENGEPIQNLAIIKEPLWGDEDLKSCTVIGKAKSEIERADKLTRVADNFVIFPGSGGTLHEATAVIQMNQYPEGGKLKKIVLVDPKFWSGLVEQYKTMFYKKFIKDFPVGKLFHLVDSQSEILNLIMKK